MPVYLCDRVSLFELTRRQCRAISRFLAEYKASARQKEGARFRFSFSERNFFTRGGTGSPFARYSTELCTFLPDSTGALRKNTTFVLYELQKKAKRLAFPSARSVYRKR